MIHSLNWNTDWVKPDGQTNVVGDFIVHVQHNWNEPLSYANKTSTNSTVSLMRPNHTVMAPVDQLVGGTIDTTPVTSLPTPNYWFTDFWMNVLPLFRCIDTHHWINVHCLNDFRELSHTGRQQGSFSHIVLNQTRKAAELTRGPEPRAAATTVGKSPADLSLRHSAYI